MSARRRTDTLFCGARNDTDTFLYCMHAREHFASEDRDVRPLKRQRQIQTVRLEDKGSVHGSVWSGNLGSTAASTARNHKVVHPTRMKKHCSPLFSETPI